MDTTILLGLIGLAGTVVGWYGKVLLAATKGKPTWNGQERREQLLGTIQGQIAIHTIGCPNLTAVLTRLASIEGKLDDHVKFHMEQRH